MIDYLKRIRHLVTRWVRLELFLRFSDRKGYVRNKFFDQLRALSSFVTRNEMTGGCLSQDGDFYLRTHDEIYLYYNFTDKRYTFGDGQSLDFRSSQTIGPLESFLMRYLRDSVVFVDVGANNGYYYSLKVAKRFTNSQVYCFEPDPRILYHLEKNVRCNRLTNIKVIPLALSNHVGKAKMTAYLGASNFLVSNHAGPIDTIEVECTTLDDFAVRNHISQIDFLKVDIEGGEYNLLQGAQQTIRKLRPPMILELNEKLLGRSYASIQGVLSILDDLDYKCLRVKGSSDALVLPTDKMNVLSEPDYDWLEPMN